MKSFISAIQICENAKGAGSTQVRHDAVATLSEEGKRLVREALSPFRVFGVKKFKMPKVYAESDADAVSIIQLLDDLHDRKFTGGAAQDEIARVLSLYTEETAQYLARILKKNLKWGTSAETVNVVFTGEKRPANPVVPVYACMLAAKFDKKKYEWKFPLLIEAKYDGRRNNAFMINSNLDHKARSGKPSSDLDGLFDEDFEKLNAIVGDDFVVDGEAMAGSWKESMEAKRSGNDEAKNNLRLFAYDFVLFDEWESEGIVPRSRMTNLQRCQYLEDIIERAGCEKIIKSKWKLINSVEEAYEFYDEVLAEGYEGAMLKDPHAHYVWGRSKAWTKWKPVETFDGRVTGFYEGDADKEFAGTLGGVYVEGVDENGVKFKCKVGSGFKTKDEDQELNRDYIYNNQELFLGRMCELEASPDLNVDEDRDYQALKWGVFKKWRDDKDA